MRDARSETFAFGLATAVVLLVLISAALFLPFAPCPVCPPSIFTITTNVTVPGAPITDPYPVFLYCGESGKVSLFNRWRFRHWRSTLVY